MTQNGVPVKAALWASLFDAYTFTSEPNSYTLGQQMKWKWNWKYEPKGGACKGRPLGFPIGSLYLHIRTQQLDIRRANEVNLKIEI